MTTRILQPDFSTPSPDNPPTPPVPTAADVRWQRQRELESADYEWRMQMSKQYPLTLPLIVPAWYPRAKTMHHAYGVHKQPVDTVANVRKQLDNGYRRLGLVAAANRVEDMELVERVAA